MAASTHVLKRKNAVLNLYISEGLELESDHLDHCVIALAAISFSNHH
jgi:hypothetical protein